MTKILYLHIGTPKTGTTALQNFFYINQNTLKSYGIHYPLNHVWYEAHHRLGWAFGHGQKDNRPADLKSSDQEWADVLKSKNDNTLISSETLSKCAEESIQRIRKYASGYDVKIIVYLRRQDTKSSSTVNQLIKYNTDTWTDVSHITRGKNHFKMIRPWADVFGKENIIVRPYEKGQFYGDTIFSDFLHYVFGLQLTDEFLLPERDHNSRLHRVALEYKQLLNFLPLPIEQKRNTVEPLRQFSQRLYDQGRNDYGVISPSQCLEMIQQYAKSNEKIAREHLGRENGKLFYDPLPDPNKPWKPYPSLLSKDDVKQISRLIAEQDQEFAKQLGRAVQMNLKSDDKDVRVAAKRLAVGLGILKNRQKAIEVCKGYCMRIMRFLYQKLPARVQPVLKKIACRLKIGHASKTGDV